VRCRYTESAPPPPKGFVVVIVIRVYVSREKEIIGECDAARARQSESAGLGALILD
jgi:hypothetical protein